MMAFDLPAAAAPAVLLGGLAAWTSLAAYNNIRAFAHGTAYVGYIMGMDGLRIENMPDSPLMARAQRSPKLHCAAFSIIILAEIVVAMVLWLAMAAQLVTIPWLARYQRAAPL